LISPVLLATDSVNQRTFEPAVIPTAPLAAVGIGNSLMACVVELISATLSTRKRVNHGLPSGPSAIPGGPATAVVASTLAGRLSAGYRGLGGVELGEP
jgi:hypothetical protein